MRRERCLKLIDIFSGGLRSAGAAAAVGILFALASPALAQIAGNTAPPTRGELTPPVDGLNERRTPTLTVDGQMERRPCALDNPEYADLTLTLNEVRYVGAERAGDVALAAAHEGYLGRELPIRALCDIRDRAAALLTDAGYLAAVEIPAQNLGNGVAEMRVVLGRLVAVRARGETRGSEKLLGRYFAQLTGQDVFNVHDAERYLLLANDIPGTDVRLSLRPAGNGEPGDLIGEIAVLRERAVLDVNVQNYGSRALGRYGGLVRAEVYGLTGAGDRTSIAAFSTLDFSEQQTLQLAHDFRLGSEGLTLGGQLTLGWTDPDALPGFAISSETVFGTLEASYPFLRTQRASVWGAFGVDIVNQDVEVNGFDLTRDRVRTAFARADFLLLDEEFHCTSRRLHTVRAKTAPGGQCGASPGADVPGRERRLPRRSACMQCWRGDRAKPDRAKSRRAVSRHQHCGRVSAGAACRPRLRSCSPIQQ